MLKLYQILESTFKLRINSNAEIIPYIKKLSEMGKFDEPKKVAAIALILDRLGKLEDEALLQESLKTIVTQPGSTYSNEAKKEPEIVDNKEWVESEEAKAKERASQTEAKAPPDETPPENQDTGTISEFSPENIVDKPAPETSS